MQVNKINVEGIVKYNILYFILWLKGKTRGKKKRKKTNKNN